MCGGFILWELAVETFREGKAWERKPPNPRRAGVRTTALAIRALYYTLGFMLVDIKENSPPLANPLSHSTFESVSL